jgi:hypothetical protein
VKNCCVGIKLQKELLFKAFKSFPCDQTNKENVLSNLNFNETSVCRNRYWTSILNLPFYADLIMNEFAEEGKYLI